MKRMFPSFLLSLIALASAAPAQAWWWDYTKTKYPVVLAHGMVGFESIGPLEYWNGIPADLNSGGARVYVARMSSFASSEVLGEQLLAQVQDILAISGAQKVNLIGHSHGNHSIRYVAGVIPGKVASATSVGGVTRGSAVADLIKQVSGLPVVGAPGTDLVTSVLNGFGWLVGALDDQPLPQDSLGALDSLTTSGTAAFSTKFPAGVPTTACGEGAYSVNGVRYYSWSGTGVLTNALDPGDYFLGLTSLAFTGKSDWQNDGMVGRCSSHLGKVLRDNYFMNHMDEVNLLFGLTSIVETDPKAVYRQHANRLKNAGL